MKWWREWRRRRILRAWQPDSRLWAEILAMPVFAGLSLAEQERMREQVILFLHDKAISAARGAEVSEKTRLQVAAQACLLILNLDEDLYAGWREIIFYPGEFVPRHQFVDEHGVVQESRHPLMGEAWLGGPLILSVADVETSVARDGFNVVLHEFAHKLDMCNGAADGLPPLHAEMRVRDWAQAFTHAYEDFCARVDRGDVVPIDPYAAESSAEFFAVLTEVFLKPPLYCRTYILMCTNRCGDIFARIPFHGFTHEFHQTRRTDFQYHI